MDTSLFNLVGICLFGLLAITVVEFVLESLLNFVITGSLKKSLTASKPKEEPIDWVAWQKGWDEFAEQHGYGGPKVVIESPVEVPKEVAVESEDESVHNSQFIPLDVSLAAANAENESLRAKLKDADVGLRNGEKIAGERIAQLQKTADARLTTTFIFAGVGGAIICAVMCWASFLKEDRNAIQRQCNDTRAVNGVLHAQLDKAEAERPPWGQRASVDYWQQRAEDADVALKRAVSAPPSLKEAGLREQIAELEEKLKKEERYSHMIATSSTELLNKRNAQVAALLEEKAELEKKLASPRPEKTELKFDEYKQEAKQIVTSFASDEAAKKKEAQLRERLVRLNDHVDEFRNSSSDKDFFDAFKTLLVVLAGVFIVGCFFIDWKQEFKNL